MAAVRIHTGINPDETASLVPRHQWAALVRERNTECRSRLRGDCRQLLFYIEDAAKFDWLGFGDRERYIRDGLGLDLQLVDWAVDGLRALDGAHAIPFDEAVVLGKRGAPAGNDNAAKERENKPDNVGIDLKYGNDRRSTLARLKRDHPDLAARVVAGKLTAEDKKAGKLSANAAAIAAGFRVRSITVPLDPERTGKILRRHFTREQFTVLVRSFADDE